MNLNLNRWTRKLHRWGALVTFIPLILVIATGLLLQVKKQVAWVQPPTMKGTPIHHDPDSATESVGPASWDTILASVESVEEAEADSWDDIDRLHVRPGEGIVKIQCKNRWEVQLDLSDGSLLSANYRRSDWIESLHDGSFFADSAKLWIFLPNGLVLLGLWFTGVYLWWLPIGARRKKKRRSLDL